MYKKHYFAIAPAEHPAISATNVATLTFPWKIKIMMTTNFFVGNKEILLVPQHQFLIKK